MDTAPVSVMLAATEPVMEPIRPLEMTATCAPPERILVLADIATSMMVLMAPKASIRPPKMVKSTMVFAETEASMPYTPPKLVVTCVIRRWNLRPPWKKMPGMYGPKKP